MSIWSVQWPENFFSEVVEILLCEELRNIDSVTTRACEPRGRYPAETYRVKTSMVLAGRTS